MVVVVLVLTGGVGGRSRDGVEMWDSAFEPSRGSKNFTSENS